MRLHPIPRAALDRIAQRRDDLDELLEEPFFLAFLCYLGLVIYAGALRFIDSRATRSSKDRAVNER